MQFTSLEIAMGFLGVCLAVVACAAIIGVLVMAERNRFERYERLRGVLLDICNPQSTHAVKLLAVHELRNYREYAGVVARALEKPAPPQEKVQPTPAPSEPSASNSQPVKVQPRLKIVPRPAVPTQPQLAPFPAAERVTAKLAVVETPKRDILDGVIIRERGRPVKASVLREFLRFRDAVTDRLTYREY